MWGLIFETLFDVLPWQVQLALYGSIALLIAILVFWATRA